MSDLDRKIDSLADSLTVAVQDAVKIRSVEAPAAAGQPYGPAVAQALDKALALAASLGFKTVNLDGYAGYAEYGPGEEHVAVLGHLDVVPEGSGWSYPPYGGEIHDGRIYGRGTQDDKGPLLAALFGLKAIKDLGLPLTRKVRIIFGTNEETGCNEMKYYLAKEKPPVMGFTPDAEFPVIFGEKGLLQIILQKSYVSLPNAALRLKYINGGERVNIVPDYCEAGVEAADPQGLIAACQQYACQHKIDMKASMSGDLVIIKTHGLSAHGSLPHLGRNAIMQLVGFLDTCKFGGGLGQFIETVTRRIGNETDGHSLGIDFADADSGKLSLNVGIIRMTEDTIAITCDIRFPVTIRGEQVTKPLTDQFTATGFEVIPKVTAPLYFPKDHPLIQTLMNVFTSYTGQNIAPMAIGGGTYAKTIPNIVAFGPQFPGKPELCHQANEYIDIAELILCAKIYAAAIYELAK